MPALWFLRAARVSGNLSTAGKSRFLPPAAGRGMAERFTAVDLG